MNSQTTNDDETLIMDPQERRWLERKALQLMRELNCPLPEALVAARGEFERLRSRPRAVVLQLVSRSRKVVRRPHEASS